MRKFLEYIIVWYRLAKALKRFMPIEDIRKADFIIPHEMEIQQRGDGEQCVRYTFWLMSEEAFNRNYKIDYNRYFK
jgi:hypothetical protein